MKRAGYPKLVAEWYDISRADPSAVEIDYYLGKVPLPTSEVLELACGNGRLLIPMAKRGIVATGTDASPHMLEMCARRARDEGVAPTLHLQRMEELDLNDRFGMVFIADGTFGLLIDDHDIVETLRRVRNSLRPGGCFAFDFEPPQPSIGQLGQWLGRWIEGADGTIITRRECRRFDETRLLLESLRIEEKWLNGAPVESASWTERYRFHARDTIIDLCTDAGFASVEITRHFDHPDATDPELQSVCCVA